MSQALNSFPELVSKTTISFTNIFQTTGQQQKGKREVGGWHPRAIGLATGSGVVAPGQVQERWVGQPAHEERGVMFLII